MGFHRIKTTGAPRRLFFFIALALVLGLAVGCTNGGDDGKDDNKHPSATTTLSIPEIVGADGYMITQGQVVTDTIDGASNALMVAVKDGNVYLYHPALGNVALSEETTALAIGYFILNSAMAAATVKKTKRNAIISTDSGEVMLDTKIRMNLYPAESGTIISDEGQVDYYTPETLNIENTLRRWVAVNHDPAQKDKVLYIPPRQTTFDNLSNIFSTAQTVFDKLGYSYSFAGMLGGNAETILLPDDGIYAFEKPIKDPMHTYASEIRYIPFFLFNKTILKIDQLNAWEWYKATVLDAYQQDPDIFATVNILDLAQLICEGVEHIINAAMPTSCSILLLEKMFMKSVRSQLIFALTGDIDIRNTYWSKDLQDMGHDLAMCLGESSVVLSIPWPSTAPVTGYIAALSAAVSKLTNTITALRYLGDDIILASLTNFYASAYDKCEFEELDVEDDDDTGPTDDTPVEEWQCTIYGAPGSKAISAAVSFDGKTFKANTTTPLDDGQTKEVTIDIVYDAEKKELSSYAALEVVYSGGDPLNDVSRYHEVSGVAMPKITTSSWDFKNSLWFSLTGQALKRNVTTYHYSGDTKTLDKDDLTTIKIHLSNYGYEPL